MVDSTFRWTVVAILTGLFTAAFVWSAWRKQYPQRNYWQVIGIGAALVAAGLLLGRFFGERLVDALLLQAVFGFPVPDEAIHGYGWLIVVGYVLMMSAAVTLVARFFIILLKRSGGGT